MYGFTMKNVLPLGVPVPISDENVKSDATLTLTGTSSNENGIATLLAGATELMII